MQGCMCGHRPRPVAQSVALCRCRHLIWVPTTPFRPDPLGTSWTPHFDPTQRAAILAELKARVDLDKAAPSADVRDATEAARLAGQNQFADDLDFAHWIASLEE
jgi:hypothetical protein